MKFFWGEAGLALRLVTSVLCCAALVVGYLSLRPTRTAAAAFSSATEASSAPATLSVTSGGRAIPRSFFGLSIEYKELQDYENEGSLFNRVISLVKPEDGSKMVLRVGGKSADHVYWQATNAKPPQWVSVLKTSWLDRLNTLVRQNKLRVMLDLNLAVHSPTLAADFAAAARQMLPGGSLAGLEVGNEPDEYWRQAPLEKQRIPSTHVASNWATNYNASDYARDFASYARTLKAKFPGVALGGPEIISSKPAWLSALDNLGSLSPSFLTIHRYASSTCWPSTSPWYPKLSTMLSENASAGLANTVHSAAVFAHDHHQLLRLSEVNSISCGGNQGVANSFAVALWAPDALFSMIRTGVDAVSWHIRPTTLNAPFIASNPHSIKVLPELYGLAVFAQMTRPGSVLLNSKLSAPGSLHVKGWAVRYPGGMRVLLINKGPNTANMNLNLGFSGHAFVKRLTAPGVGATGGVRFGGQLISKDGRWLGKAVAPAVPSRGGRYSV
ncbi:MAG: glycosyl hydrolase family 79 C-terminal domain-containing protein, partial [Solirubrobacteraceae bacterium]